jgi:mRNA interferase RelE/StbE
MKPYKVVLTKSAEKSLGKIPNRILVKVIQDLQNLELNPRPKGCKKLVNFDNLWRICIGDYQVIYSMDDVILCSCYLQCLSNH